MTKTAMEIDLSPSDLALKAIHEPLTGSTDELAPERSKKQTIYLGIRQLKLKAMIRVSTAYFAVLLPVWIIRRLAT